jgi:hypothetical protein
LTLTNPMGCYGSLHELVGVAVLLIRVFPCGFHKLALGVDEAVERPSHLGM